MGEKVEVGIYEALQYAASRLYDHMRWANEDADRIAAAKALGELMLAWDDHILMREQIGSFSATPDRKG